ncbi:MAG: hypothetical protein K2I79_00505, partial [Clostridia bacterium]|nr:hypothetical protein [Clostridia bacterium]
NDRSFLLLPLIGKLLGYVCYWGLFLVAMFLFALFMLISMSPSKLGQFSWVFTTYLLTAVLPLVLYIVFIMLPRWLPSFNPKLVSYICDKLNIEGSATDTLRFGAVRYLIIILGILVVFLGGKNIVSRRCDICGYVRSESISYSVSEEVWKDTWGVIEGEDGKKYELNSYHNPGIEDVYSHTTYDCPQCYSIDNVKELVKCRSKKY